MRGEYHVCDNAQGVCCVQGRGRREIGQQAAAYARNRRALCQRQTHPTSSLKVTGEIPVTPPAGCLRATESPCNVYAFPYVSRVLGSNMVRSIFRLVPAFAADGITSPYCPYGCSLKLAIGKSFTRAGRVLGSTYGGLMSDCPKIAGESHMVRAKWSCLWR